MHPQTIGDVIDQTTLRMRCSVNLLTKIFSYKTNFILLVCLASLASSYTIMFKNQKWVEEQRQIESRSTAVQKMNPFKRIVNSKIDEMKNELVGFALARKNHSASLNFSNFNAVALMRPTSTGYVAKWRELNLKDATHHVDADFSIFNKLPFDKIQEQGFALYKIQDGQNRPLYAVLFEIEGHRNTKNNKAFLLGLSSQNPIESVTEDYKGTGGRLYLLNDKAFVAAHTEKNYVGDSFSEDPIYKDIAHSGRSQQARIFTDLSGHSAYAYYEKVEHSNLYAVISAPHIAGADIAAQRWQAGAPTILALLGLFGVLAFFFTKFATYEKIAEVGAEKLPEQTLSQQPAVEAAVDDEFESIHQKVLESNSLKTELMKKGLASINPFAQEKLLAPEPVVAQPLAIVEVKDDTSIQLLKDMSKGISRIFTERISGMLAQASLILAKTNDEEIKSHAKAIEKESRKSRELLRELEQFSGDLARAKSSISLSEVCIAAVQSVQSQLDLEEINLSLDVDSEIKVQAHIEKLQSAIEKILRNSIEAMRGRDEKSLKIQTKILSGQAELVISDNGIGMSKDVQAKIFTPFYRAFENTDSNGLGLSYVQGVIASLAGEISVHSNPGTGTEMKIKLPAERSIQKLTPVEVPPPIQSQNYNGLKNPSLNVDFIADPPAVGVFELDEKDLDKDFDIHLQNLSDQIAQKNVEPVSEFNSLKNFDDDDDDVDHFKVMIREPRSKTLS